MWTQFNLRLHSQLMKEKHPTWSERQCRNSRYWQGTARSILRDEVRFHLTRFGLHNAVVCYAPEAIGVNVTATMARVGVCLDWPPKVFCFQVALVGIR